ncbi:AIR synthase related protein [Ammoniphilus sp. YIM 78166]|uniref:AIR synthase related protein n=1 Tax=Ammoniphilus sp. YIM 78166 TaxID=1644106 RepID=UPI00106F861A|nr:AIR synthase related protein [Ammoniphilus sp. YIM 78166]
MNLYPLERFRDLTILSLGDRKLVFACDSSSGVGSKPMDQVNASPYAVGRFLARTALMEIISVGAKPCLLFNTLNVEMNPMGKQIIKGIQDEAAIAGIVEDGINGSTEDNMVTVQTGAGIVIMGEAPAVIRHSNDKDFIVCIGFPKVGNEVTLDDPEITDVRTVMYLRGLIGVHEIVPVGSKGIGYEIKTLVDRNRLNMEWLPSTLSLDKSAGPSTCVIVTLEQGLLTMLQQQLTQPLTVLGRLR